jgi:VWFA-related protein
MRALLAVVVFAAVTIEASTPQQPVFKARADVVQIDALVTSDGKPVRGLSKDDFEVRDNGVVQTIDFVSFDERPVNVILALDMSRSVAGLKLERLREAGRALLEGLRKDDRAALITFSHVVSGPSLLTTDVAAVGRALDEARANGDTSLVDGTYAAMALGDPEDGRSLAIVFSDGLDSASFLTADAVRAAARRSNVVVYGVATGDRHADFLRDVTNETGGRLLLTAGVGDFRAAFLEIVAEFRHRYLLGYAPRGVADDGWHKLDVRVRGRSASVKARPGYQRFKTSREARWPLTTAPSIVPGKPVSVQSPAR